MVLMSKGLKKLVTNGLIVYGSLIVAYVVFFIFIIYFKQRFQDAHVAYIITMNLLVMLNINIMSVIFIRRFNKINKRIGLLINTLGYEDED